MLSNQDIPAAVDSRPGHERLCSVCNHPERSAIDRYLLQSSVRRAAARFGLSKSAIHRHRDSHMPALLAAGEQLLERRLALAAPKLRARLEQIHAQTAGYFLANDGVDRNAAFKGLTLLTRQVDLALRVAGSVPSSAETGPDAVELFGQAILRVLQPYPEIRDQVVAAIREVEAQLRLHAEEA